MLNRATFIDLDHRKMDDDEDPEALPNAPALKRSRGEIDSLSGPDDPMEHLGDSKRMHLDSNVTAVNQIFEHSSRCCMNE